VIALPLRHSRSPLPAALALLECVLAASAALAASPTMDPLEAAFEAVDDLRYEEALELLDQALARRDLSATDRNRGLELEAACRMYLGDRPAALAGFSALSRRDPGWSLAGDYPPRVRALFDDAVAAGLVPVEVRLESVPTLGLAGVAVRVTQGQDAVEQVWLVVRLPNGTTVREPFVERGGTLQAPLPPETTTQGSAVLYTVQAAAPSGFVLATLSGEWTSPDLASPLPPPPPPPPPLGGGLQPPPPVVEETAWYESWWFWTIVGVAVAGGATTAGVLLYDPGGPRDGSAGNWEVW
jgi:hypothetical protein